MGYRVQRAYSRPGMYEATVSILQTLAVLITFRAPSVLGSQRGTLCWKQYKNAGLLAFFKIKEELTFGLSRFWPPMDEANGGFFTAGKTFQFSEVL